MMLFSSTSQGRAVAGRTILLLLISIGVLSIHARGDNQTAASAHFYYIDCSAAAGDGSTDHPEGDLIAGLERMRLCE
jgi:hypothetical protein